MWYKLVTCVCVCVCVCARACMRVYACVCGTGSGTYIIFLTASSKVIADNVEH